MQLEDFHGTKIYRDEFKWGLNSKGLCMIRTSTHPKIGNFQFILAAVGICKRNNSKPSKESQHQETRRKKGILKFKNFTEKIVIDF